VSKLARKININNWPEELGNISDIGADAITQCMKTQKNAMSVFQISSEDQIDEAFLALATNADRLESFDVVMMDQAHILSQGMRLIQTPGTTPVKNLQDTHYEVTNLSYGKLAPIAYHVFECVRDGHWKRRTKGELKGIVGKAINEGRITSSGLKDGVKKDMGLIPG
jgi:hypothetical protein